MREFIKSLFDKEKIINLNYSLYDTLFIKEKYHTYYLFFFLTDDNSLLELKNNASELYHIIKDNKDIYEVDMDKNITCIYCLKVDNNEYYETEETGTISELSKKICVVEEDLDYFKKNVLLYTESMDEFANTNIGKFEVLCQEQITESKFQEYKKSNVDNYQYDFLLNLFIKLPFLNFHKYQLKSQSNSENQNSYRNLNSFIEEACIGLDKDSILNEILLLEEKINDENILYNWIDELKKKGVKNSVHEEGIIDEN